MADLTRKGNDSTVRQNLETAPVTGQDKSHPHFDREPKKHEIPDQGFVLATVGGTMYIYARKGDQVHKAPMTAI
jgi:hypothetical protein